LRQRKAMPDLSNKITVYDDLQVRVKVKCNMQKSKQQSFPLQFLIDNKPIDRNPDYDGEQGAASFAMQGVYGGNFLVNLDGQEPDKIKEQTYIGKIPETLDYYVAGPEGYSSPRPWINNNYFMEKIIGGIAKGKSIGIRLFWLNSTAYKPVSTVIPRTTNCFQLKEDGDISFGMVNGFNLSARNATGVNGIGILDNIVENGFKKIDPFKTYFSNFSFFVDFKAVDYSKFGTVTDENGRMGFQLDDLRKVNPSCSSKFFLFYHDRPKVHPAYSYPLSNTVIIKRDNSENDAQTAIHEIGHAIAGLIDEYVLQKLGTIPRVWLRKNCVLNPEKEYKYNNKLYGENNIKGCLYEGYDYRPSGGHTYGHIFISYFRPSYVSILNTAPYTDPRFNLVSCGYLLKEIKKQGSAKEQWSECETLDVIKPQEGSIPVTLTSDLSI